MVKQMISGLLEDWLGEYILNISKDNLKVAAVRGKVKLDNVELDGDLIGSHVMGAVGLSGFGVLSCWARSLRISIPWKSLEKSPTKLQIQGLHLICVPLLPSTSSRKCGGCTLRTRAKRSALARYERNFFSRRIPGEGPPAPGQAQGQQQSKMTWKAKLRAKIFRNIEVSINTVHLRCEVPQNGLDFLSQTIAEDQCAFSFGFTLDSLTINTATSTWQTGTINFDSNPQDNDPADKDKPKTNQTFKVLEIKNMAVYWDDNPPFLITHSAQVWRRTSYLADAMQAMMTTQDPGPDIRKLFSLADPNKKWPPPNMPHNYCCKPLSFKIRMTFTDSTSPQGQQSFCHAELLPFHINIDLLPHQHRQYSKLRNIMISQQRFDTMVQQRPQQRPSDDPKAWWHYVIACVITRPTSRPWRDVLKITKHRQRYIQLVTHKILIQKELSKRPPSLLMSGGYHGGLTDQESQELLLLEEMMPIEALLSFHLLALRQVLDIQQRSTDATASAPNSGGTTNTSYRRRRAQSFDDTSSAPNSNATIASPPRHKRHSSIERFRRVFVGASKKRNSISNIKNSNNNNSKHDDNENIHNNSGGDGMAVQLLPAYNSFDSGLIDMSSHDNNEIQQQRQPQNAPLEPPELQRFDSSGEDAQEPLQIFFQVHDVSARVKLLMNMSGSNNDRSIVRDRSNWKSNIEPILQMELDTNGLAKLRAGGKTQFTFDVKRFEVFDCLVDPSMENSIASKIMTVRAISNSSSHLGKEERKSAGGNGSKPAKDDKDFDLFLGGFPSLSEFPSSFSSLSFETKSVASSDAGTMELPAGVVCRVKASANSQSLDLVVSAHPATLVWNKACLDAVNDFFSDPTTHMQSILTAQLRNAATPLAHKAQLALMAPKAVYMKMFIDAPKLWIPVSSHRAADGALFLDAGKVKMDMSKEERVMETNWQVDASDIQIKFVRGISLPSGVAFHSWLDVDSPTAQKDHSSSSSKARKEIEIVRPFHVHLDASVVQEKEKHGLVASISMTNVALVIGKISLNFVDVEVLAKAVGKWYAAELLRVQGRTTAGEKSVKSFKSRQKDPNQQRQYNTSLESTAPCEINITIEQVEMALQGYSAQQLSLASYSQKYKAYLVEIIGIKCEWKREAHHTISRLTVSDASIIQAKNLVTLLPSTEPHHQMLVRSLKTEHSAANSDILSSPGEHFSIPTSDTPMTTTPQRKHTRNSSFSTANNFSVGYSSIFTAEAPQTSAGISPILCASHFHDRKNHNDEIEIDVESVLVRVTPTSLGDCSQGLHRIFELGRIMTREMERRVHEEGRMARRKGRNVLGNAPKQTNLRSQGRHTLSTSHSTSSDENTEGGANENAPSDSSLLFKLTLKEAAILMGKPALDNDSASSPTRRHHHHRDEEKQQSESTDAVVQILSNALVMFQSIENADTSGKKTIHVSIDDLSSSINTEFQPIFLSEVPPMIGPTAAECRIVYHTENLGCVVLQEFSVDCDSIKSCLTPIDLRVLTSVVREMTDRFRSFGSSTRHKGESVDQESSLSSGLIKFKKKGTGIATRIRFELQTLSFVTLRPFKSKHGARPLFDLNADQLKGKFEGCISAMSGECSSVISMNFFNTDIADWEHAVEPFQIVATIEQMPNELIVSLACSESISMNLTGVFLSDVAEMGFDFSRESHRESDDIDRNDGATISPNPMASSVGLRRATECNSVELINESGVDVVICPMGEINTSVGGKREIDQYHPSSFLVKDGDKVSLDSCFGGSALQKLSDLISNAFPSLALGIPPTAETHIGKREDVFDLPVTTSTGYSISLMKLQPDSSEEKMSSKEFRHGRNSPDTILSETSASVQNDFHFYTVEPVVEWCVQNQRLRSSTTDIFSLERGKDILSSSTWSPGDEYFSPDRDRMRGGVNSGASVVSSGSSGSSGNWLRPYLKNDSPEWTDFTNILRFSRDCVMLPDNNWIWCSDWQVHVDVESTDTDGWEYETDFETFKRTRRFYKRGDTCRRRRWTRTRIIKPPRLDDPKRTLSFVWETKREENGNFMLKIRSPLAIQNCTSISLSFFAYSYSWDDDILIGTAAPGASLSVPIQLASATYIRLAKKNFTEHAFLSKTNSPLNAYIFSERIMVLSTGYISSKLHRASLSTSRRDKERNLDHHFVVNVKCTKGITEVVVEPVIKIVNLLPCQLECQLGELIRRGEPKRSYSKRSVIGRGKRKVAKVEELVIASTEEAKSSSVDCVHNKPHLSLRVPGYQWSPWQRIVNRKANSFTWQPSEVEEEYLFQAERDDADHAEEYKTVVHFDSLVEAGDPLTLIMSVEAGHCPILRIYAQYWIVDKTGFGLRFAEGFEDILGQKADPDTLRSSHLVMKDARSLEMKRDMKLPGNQWSIGMSGLSMYFSRREKLALCIDKEIGNESSSTPVKSKWTSPMDVSNVMPKTVFSAHEYDGSKQFELAFNVTLCPSVFSRTKLINFFPRYQILNALDQDLFLAQDGCLGRETFLPSQSSIPVHWEKSSLAPKIRFCVAPNNNDDKGEHDDETLWTNGGIQLDKVGITSIRLPTCGGRTSSPLVVQVEVRLATKKQSSAVVVVIWSTKSNPLYLLRNRSSLTILCSQPINGETVDKGTMDELLPYESCSAGDSRSRPGGILSKRARRTRAREHPNKSSSSMNSESSDECGITGLECGPNIPVIGFLYEESREEYIWKVPRGEECCFGFDDPEKAHYLEWTCAGHGLLFGQKQCEVATLEVDAMGSSSILMCPNGAFVKCHIRAEQSTKVIEFIDVKKSPSNDFRPNTFLAEMKTNYETMLENQGLSLTVENDEDDIIEDDDFLAFTLRIDLPGIAVSVIDNVAEAISGREILLLQLDSWMLEFSQSREGYHEMEMRLMSLQMDNHVHKAVHPVLIFCPRLEENEPFLHMSAVRRLQPDSSTYVFRYAALRILAIDIFLDRRTAETIARFIQPLRKVKEVKSEDPEKWVRDITLEMESHHFEPDGMAAGDFTPTNLDRIYFEQLHLHPVRLSLTFTQESMDWNPVTEGLMIFQFIRGMASIASAPLTFTSFVVSHAFEEPQALLRIVSAHYSSQLTQQIFGILGSLAILGAPADFLANVGTGVRDFFYEPINGLVHGPEQFIEGLEAGTQSLARGVFVGVVRGAANVTEVVNHNLAGLTADEVFIGERNAHQRILTDAMSRGIANRTIGDSLYLAGASVARGVKSGAIGIVEQPAIYASKHGPIGLLKGVGKALVGAVVKPVVGVGDAAVLVMNHVSEATSDKVVLLKIPKRLRRALPRKSSDIRHSVQLVAYDERAAKAQKIVTGGESLDDVYVGHVNTSTHLIIASEQCLWVIERESRDPWCLNWEEVSHFGMLEGGNMQITVFSQTGLKSHVFHVDTPIEFAQLYQLLTMQRGKMGNCSIMDSSTFNDGAEQIFQLQIPGVKAQQNNHVFGSFNMSRRNVSSRANDEIEVVEQCFDRVKKLGSEKSTFFESLDEEAWTLVYSWGQVFSGLSSRRCIAAGIINGTMADLQIKSTKLLEGGSPCYSIPTKEFNDDQHLLHPGGAIILFGWGVVPNLLQDGRVFMNIETNAFVADLSVWKGHSSKTEFQSTHALPMPGYKVGFLEKSYDDSGWWAKYWLLVRKI